MNLKVSDAKREEGFTLIELLVVVIIIGILAAIAIPVFLNQRERAWQRAADSDVRNIAIEVESFFNDDFAYPTDPGGDGLDAGAGGFTDEIVPDIQFSPDVTMVEYNVRDDGNAYCLTVNHDRVIPVGTGDNVVSGYVSDAGGFQNNLAADFACSSLDGFS